MCGRKPASGGGDSLLGLHPGSDDTFGNADDILGSLGVAHLDNSGEAVDDTLFGFGVTGNNGDHGRFKTPSLRNVGLKTSLMHVGWIEGVQDALDFYNSGTQNTGHVQFTQDQSSIPGDGNDSINAIDISPPIATGCDRCFSGRDKWSHSNHATSSPGVSRRYGAARRGIGFMLATKQIPEREIHLATQGTPRGGEGRRCTWDDSSRRWPRRWQIVGCLLVTNLHEARPRFR